MLQGMLNLGKHSNSSMQRMRCEGSFLLHRPHIEGYINAFPYVSTAGAVGTGAQRGKAGRDDSADSLVNPVAKSKDMVVISNLSPAPSDLTSSPEGSLAESDIKPIVRAPSSSLCSGIVAAHHALGKEVSRSAASTALMRGVRHVPISVPVRCVKVGAHAHRGVEVTANWALSSSASLLLHPSKVKMIPIKCHHTTFCLQAPSPARTSSCSNVNPTPSQHIRPCPLCFH